MVQNIILKVLSFARFLVVFNYKNYDKFNALKQHKYIIV